MPRLMVRRIAAAFGVLTAACALAAGLTTATAAADDTPPGLIDASDIQVSVAYDKTAYDSDETLTVTLTVTNNSDETATGVTAYNSTSCTGSFAGWPGFGDPYGISIAPHSTQTAQLSGAVPSYAVVNGVLTCAGSLRGGNIVGASTLPFSTTTTITQVYGDYHGVVYVDRNGDGAFEAGEGLSGITASYLLNGANDPTQTPVVTGSDGQFALTHVAIGTYGINFSSPGNWVVGGPGMDGNYTSVTVTRAATATGYFPAKRPLSDRLHATVGFDQATYKPGDTVHVTVTLRNSSNAPIPAVIADCNRIGDENSINSGGAAWGALDSAGAGATIPAGRTKVFHVALPLPSAAQKNGYVSAFCVFGPEPDQLPEVGFPGTPAYAKVPGLTAAFFGRVAQADDTPVTSTKVRVLDYGTQHVVATAVTDAQGGFKFAALPAGQYTLDVVGPWQFTSQPYDSYFRAVSPGSTQYPWGFTVKHS